MCLLINKWERGWMLSACFVDRNWYLLIGPLLRLEQFQQDFFYCWMHHVIKSYYKMLLNLVTIFLRVEKKLNKDTLSPASLKNILHYNLKIYEIIYFFYHYIWNSRSICWDLILNEQFYKGENLFLIAKNYLIVHKKSKM